VSARSLLGAVIDTQTRLGEIRVALKPDPALHPGAFARGAVIVNQAERPVLPQTAVMSDSEGTYVFIVNARNQIERRPVIRRKINVCEGDRLRSQVAIRVLPIVFAELGFGWFGWCRKVLFEKFVLLHQAPADDLIGDVEAVPARNKSTPPFSKLAGP
jgi:hypothetical protein